jgi:uncharacterized protein
MTLQEKYIYPIAIGDKFIVYQPLNRFAFICNEAMIDLITERLNGVYTDSIEKAKATLFLDSFGFFNEHTTDINESNLSSLKPTAAVLCLTSSCNFACTYCYAKNSRKNNRDLDPEAGRVAIDAVYSNAKEQKFDNFRLSFHGGGEPTLSFSRLKEFIFHARSKDLRCITDLTSNGFWTDEQASWIIANLDMITLSFDGISPVQNKQRPLASGYPSFGRVFSNIKRLDAAGVKYGIRMTVSAESSKRLAENIEFMCASTACSTFHVEPVFCSGFDSPVDFTDSAYPEFAHNFLNAYDIATSNGRELIYSGSRPWTITTRFCTAPYKALVVTPSAKISTCYEITDDYDRMNEVFCTGEITRDQKIRIHNDRIARFDELIEGRRQKCKSCICYWHCAGDCPARTIDRKSSDNNSFGQRCDTNRAVTTGLIMKYLEKNNGIYKG